MIVLMRPQQIKSHHASSNIRTSCGVVLFEVFKHPPELFERNLPAVRNLDVRVLQKTHRNGSATF